MTGQCSVSLLESALAGNLPVEQEVLLQQHLNECDACNSAMERLAGGSSWCQDAILILTSSEALPELPREEFSEIDFTVEHLEPSEDPNALGQLAGYDVLEVIGRGGMGVVLKGYDRALKRCVAIKVLAPHLAQSSLAKKRFAREAQAAAAVVHPNVLAIHQVQPSGRLPFLVMPLVAGESLAHRLASKGSLELTEVLRIGMQAAAGLAAAHEQGLVHRDVKPANILLEKGVERAVLTDFGLARAADDVAITRWGIIAGTPQYMSPEQAKGEAVDGRSDLFSLGCVLYETATGVSPFRTDSTMATLRRLIDEQPQAISSLNPELPPWFIGIVEKLLEKDPGRRFQSAKEVSDLLESCLAHVQQPTSIPLPSSLPVQAKLRRRFTGRIAIAIGSLLLGIGVVGAVMVATADPPDISGQWTSDEWGNVVLTQKSPDEYAGSYRFTYDKAGADVSNESTLAFDSLRGFRFRESPDASLKPAGEIHLQWSRIERQFKGTWKEGTRRFGKISARLHGDEIRGAWTTDRESKENPATPELSDLTWSRIKADPKTDASSAASSPDIKGRWKVLGAKGLKKEMPPETYIEIDDQTLRFESSKTPKDKGAYRYVLEQNGDVVFQAIRNGVLKDVILGKAKRLGSKLYLAWNEKDGGEKHPDNATGENAEDGVFYLTLERDLQSLVDAAKHFNAETADVRSKMFTPPIPDLTADRLREGFRQTANLYRREGKQQVADALQKIVESGRLPNEAIGGLISSGVHSKDENGVTISRQIAPALILPDDTVQGGNRLTFLRPLELMYRKDGTSSKDYGDQFDKEKDGLPLATQIPENNRYIKGWGRIIDPDGDCTIKIDNDSTASIMVPDALHDLSYSETNSGQNAPRILREVEGDFIVRVKVSGEFEPGEQPAVEGKPIFQSAGLLLWIRNDHFVRLERNIQRFPQRCICFAPLLEQWKDKELVGEPSPVADSEFFKGKSTYLQLERTGNDVMASISHDGSEWIACEPIQVKLPHKVSIGVSAINTSNKPFKVKFEDYTLIVRDDDKAEVVK